MVPFIFFSVHWPKIFLWLIRTITLTFWVWNFPTDLMIFEQTLEALRLCNFSYLIILLSFILIMVIRFIHLHLLGQSGNKNFWPRSLRKLYLIISILILSIFVFRAQNSLNFYITFEVTLVPIFLLILGWGYQPERKYAALLVFFYTLRFSLPLLIFLIIIIDLGWRSFFLTPYINTLVKSSSTDMVLTWVIFLAFLVKFPIYIFHVWLPNAHVEAPVEGSIILAAILLKFGGIGLYRLSPYIDANFTFLNSGFILWALTGGAIATFLCLQQTDLKIIIAYSSVSHISLAIALFFLPNTEWTLILLILLVHGNCSAALFYYLHTIYLLTNSRNKFYNSGLKFLVRFFNIFWVILVISNAAAPPRTNIIIEIWSVCSLIDYNHILIPPILFILALRTLFNILIYITVQKLLPSLSLINFIPSSFASGQLLIFQIRILGIYLFIFPLFSS